MRQGRCLRRAEAAVWSDWNAGTCDDTGTRDALSDPAARGWVVREWLAPIALWEVERGGPGLLRAALEWYEQD